MKRFLLLLSLCLLLAGALSACKQERSIEKSEIINGELVLTYSDGSTENLGSVTSALAQNGEKGETGAQGEKGEAGAQGAQGEKGETGASGITPQIRINADTNEWEVSTDNGQSWTSTNVKATGQQGEAGTDGVTPQIRINDTTKEWEVSYDNGSTWSSTGVSAIAGTAGTQDGASSENTQELAFYPLPDGTYGVEEGNAFYLESIVIPATYKGKPVTKILENAFRGNKQLRSVTIPESVTCIESYAFYQCTQLSSITIPESVTCIESYAFYQCTQLSSVTFESTEGWWISTDKAATSGTSLDVSNPTSNDGFLASTYFNYYWKRTAE